MSTPELGLIVTDLDGTFFGAHSTPLEENARALSRASSLGIAIAIASGRLPCVCSRVARDTGLDACRIIGLNGGFALDKPFGEAVALHPFADALAREILSILDREGCVFNAYAISGVITNQPLDEKGLARFHANFARCGCDVIVSPDAARIAAGRPILKFLVKQTGGVAGYERAKSAVSSLPPVYLTTSKADNFEIMLRGVGKAEAVAELADRLHIPLSAVMACGDFDNDKPMLSLCGLSVAMGNAETDVKASAKYVTRANTQAGVAYAVNAALDGRLDLIAKEQPL